MKIYDDNHVLMHNRNFLLSAATLARMAKFIEDNSSFSAEHVMSEFTKLSIKHIRLWTDEDISTIVRRILEDKEGLQTLFVLEKEKKQ